ncbi:hypothetical protein [Streptomyces sp. MI02-7b]|uniref:hypothetical protein n=1 Tax=Streptomyces sp. MI02-7b TaxID=462941 RepID=UPI0029B10946|nr:hypothetical protein [Streptomyces sp. MI02-7b]MDX3075723.1 hypothetical protein [Streptomyces sp. MI02-7b]
MGLFRRNRTGRRVPPPGLVEEAAADPGGWVYEIDADMVDDPEGSVPPEAVIGAWQVDAHGKLAGGYRANPNYRPPATGR